MNTKTPEINISEEFEKILPSTVRNNLFDDSEDYENLREYIIAQPYNPQRKKSPPFAGIELVDYVDFRREEVIEKATQKHKHLFFIRQSEKGEPKFCNAVGYYQRHSKGFWVLPYSYIVAKAYRQVDFPAMENRNLDGENIYITKPILFNSPEEAATFVLGRRAKLDEWVDRKGNGLLYYYQGLLSRHRQSAIPCAQQISLLISSILGNFP